MSGYTSETFIKYGRFFTSSTSSSPSFSTALSKTYTTRLALTWWNPRLRGSNSDYFRLSCSSEYGKPSGHAHASIVFYFGAILSYAQTFKAVSGSQNLLSVYIFGLPLGRAPRPCNTRTTAREGDLDYRPLSLRPP